MLESTNAKINWVDFNFIVTKMFYDPMRKILWQIKERDGSFWASVWNVDEMVFIHLNLVGNSLWLLFTSLLLSPFSENWEKINK